MPTFEYQAQSSDGHPQSGVVFGQSLDQALKDLANKGMQVTHIGVAAGTGDPIPTSFAAVRQSGAVTEAARPVPTGYVYDQPSPVEASARSEKITAQRSYVATSVVGPLVGKVALSHLLFFFRQFSTMVGAGVPMVQALGTLANQARDPRLSRVIKEMRENVEAGRTPSVAMQRYPEIFSPLMLSLVRAGEESGNLDQLLAQVADYIETEIELRGLIRRVTIYPKILLCISVIIVIGTNLIISAVAPGRSGLSSPLTTPSTWIWLGPLLVISFLFLRVGLANSRVKYNWDAFILKVPYLGRTVRHLVMAKFGRAFGALYKGGIPPTRAIELAADACGNEFLRARMYPAAQKLKEGAGITETLRGTNAFSPIVLDMTQTGETTGNLDQMLTKMADFYEDEGKTRSVNLGQIFGAVIMLGTAIYVGYIIINFWITSYGNPAAEEIKNSGG